VPRNMTSICADNGRRCEAVVWWGVAQPAGSAGHVLGNVDR